MVEIIETEQPPRVFNPEPYKWVAIYNPTDVLPQYNDDGSENRYEDIDRNRLTGFQVYRSDNDMLAYWLELEPGQRLIFRRRRQLISNGDQATITLVGWQQTVDGQNVQSLIWLFEDGMVLQTGRFRDDLAVLSAPLFLKEEE